MGKKNDKKRLKDLEVNEVSLVDKPAIEEEFIITKSVKGKEPSLLTKEEMEKAAKEKADKDAAEKLAQDEKEAKEKTDKDATEKAAADEKAAKEKADKEAADLISADPTVKAQAEIKKQLEAQDGEIKTVSKGLFELQQMLAGMIDLHYQAGASLNMIFDMTYSSLDMVSTMMEGAMIGKSATEVQTKTLTDLRKSIADEQKTHREEVAKSKEENEKKEGVEKAGAKISAARMSTLQDIATKLNGLIAEVAAAAKEVSKSAQGADEAKTKEIAELKKQLETLQKSIADGDVEVKKQVETLTKRLGELENTASPPSSLEDDVEDEEEPTEKGSSFAGVLGLDDIKKGVVHRTELLNRGKKDK